MNLCCPRCGFTTGIEVFAIDKAARKFSALLGRVPPPLVPTLFRYLTLFAPAKHAMPFAKGERLLAELVPWIEAGRITRARREWTVTLEQWESAMDQVCDKRATLTLPLKGHGYLLEVLAGAANKIEARAEAEDIQRDRSGQSRKAEAAPTSEAGEWDADRQREAAKARAVSAAVAEVLGLKRLGIAYTAETLTQQLVRAGHTPEAARFAADKAMATKA